MGYYATGNGSITFNRVLNENEVQFLADRLANEGFEYDDYTIDAPKGSSSFNVYMNAKYHDDDVKWLLETIKNIAPIADGCIEFVGEDDSNWRFVFKNGEWLEQNGQVVYKDDEPCGLQDEDAFERRTISVRSGAAPEFEMIIRVPNGNDAEKYIDEFLDGILSDDNRCNTEWNFIDGLS